MSAPEASPLHELAAALGIDTGYHDWQGNPQTVGDDTLRSVLAALDVDASTPQLCVTALEEHRRKRSMQVLPPCVVVRAGETASVTGSAGSVELESGGSVPLTLDGPCNFRPTCRPDITAYA